MTNEIRIDLRETNLPPGQIDVPDLLHICAALQVLTTRLGRAMVGQHGVGRTASSVEVASRLRLRGVRKGSVGLDLLVGESSQGADDLGVLQDLPNRILAQTMEVCHGLAVGEVPAWSSALISESVLELLDALGQAAGECVISADPREPVVLTPRSVRRDVWAVAAAEAPTRDDVAVSGTLELVDLKPPGRFRIRDDVGNAIPLLHVRNADEAKSLIGTLVTATGVGFFAPDGRITRVRDAAIAAELLPAWSSAPRPSFDRNSALAADDQGEGVDGVDPEDVAQFLSSIR